MSDYALDSLGKVSCQIYCHRHIDSALVIKEVGGPAIVNLNDVELSVDECTQLSRSLGSRKVLLLNQFSIAGFDGINNSDYLVKQAENVIRKMIYQHIALSASVTIPFASFCRFVKPDNAFLNKYHNSTSEVYLQFEKQYLNCYCLEPPSDYVSVGELIDSGSKAPNDSMLHPMLLPLEDSLDLETIISAINKRLRSIISLSNSILFKICRPAYLNVHVLDIDKYLRIDFNGRVVDQMPSIPEGEAFMSINSQPLFFAFNQSFGVQTLGVSGRYMFVNTFQVPLAWKLFRIMSSLDNNKTPLRLSSLFDTSVWQAFFDRRSSILGQVSQQFSRFFPWYSVR